MTNKYKNMLKAIGLYGELVTKSGVCFDLKSHQLIKEMLQKLEAGTHMLVPVETTEEMLAAGFYAHSQQEKESAKAVTQSAVPILRILSRSRKVYKAMIAAAQEE